ncbi:MAG: hypothetical protein RIT03_101 [Bacteroidota bacterium]|jgi:uncharacterized protein (TIGR02145 family)
MKNSFLKWSIAFVLVSLFGCTNSDGNGNSNTTVVPLVPSNLTGTLVNNQVVLTWYDNSTIETGFKIDRMVGTGSWEINYATCGADIVTYTDASVLAGTTYTYRIYSFNAVGPSVNYSNLFTITVPILNTPPVLTTLEMSYLTMTSSNSGGIIISDGGSPITNRGVVWNNLPNPTIDLTTKTSNDFYNDATFISQINGLISNTVYYVRAYATNGVGTSYGNQITFTTLPNSINVTGPTMIDIDGNLYQSVTNFDQTCIKTNLNVSKYSDGTPIPQVTDPTEWDNLTTGAWCYLFNNTANGTIYGKIYNWYALAGIYNAASANDPTLRKKLAPTGWHVLTEEDWYVLVTCLGGSEVAGGKLKATGDSSAGTGLWLSPNYMATNESGFTGLPCGGRSYNGEFSSGGSGAGWWTFSDRLFSDSCPYGLLRFITASATTEFSVKRIGHYVRCVKD